MICCEGFQNRKYDFIFHEFQHKNYFKHLRFTVSSLNMRFSSNQNLMSETWFPFMHTMRTMKIYTWPMNNIRMFEIMCNGFVLLSSLLHFFIIIILIHWNVQISTFSSPFPPSFLISIHCLYQLNSPYHTTMIFDSSLVEKPWPVFQIWSF